MRKLLTGLLLGSLGYFAGCSSSNSPTGTTTPSILTITTTSLPAGTVGAAYNGSSGSIRWHHSLHLQCERPAGRSLDQQFDRRDHRNTRAKLQRHSFSHHQGNGFEPTFLAVGHRQPEHHDQPSQPRSSYDHHNFSPRRSSRIALSVDYLQAAGGVPPYTWALAAGSSLPAGLSLSTAGVLSGTPAAASTGPLTFVVTDSYSPQTPRRPASPSPSRAEREAAA